MVYARLTREGRRESRRGHALRVTGSGHVIAILPRRVRCLAAPIRLLTDAR